MNSREHVMTSSRVIGARTLVPALACSKTRRGPHGPRSRRHGDAATPRCFTLTVSRRYPATPWTRLHHGPQSASDCARAQATHCHGDCCSWTRRQRSWLVRSAQWCGSVHPDKSRIFLAENWRRRSKFEEVAFVFPSAPDIPITLVRD